MKLLGLSLGELSTAALFVDGRIVACVSEERFSRRKNDEAYPKRAIEWVLQAGNIRGCDLNGVLIAGNILNATTHLLRTYSSWSMSDHLRAMKEYWHPRLYENKDPNFYELFRDKIDLDQYPGLHELPGKLSSYFSYGDWPVYQQFVHQTISNHLGIPKDRIHHFDHHSCHAAYAYWASPLRGADVMVLTADAFGDGLSLTVSLPDKSGGLERVHSISHDDFTLARLYRYITLVLGMKPNEHEYKVMGLAPYAKEAILKPALEIFRQHMYVDGIDVKFREKPKDYYYWFKEKLEGLRFDAIAGGLQRYTEEIMSELVRNSMRRFGAKRLVFSGGISMNVKANMLLKDLEEVDAMFVPPSGGDESLAMGVCYAYADSVLGNRDLNPLTHAYLGPSITPSEPKQLAQTAKNDGFQVYRANNQLCAELLAKNWIIGRCSGPMEFGARSLGNRAIIANPRKREIVDVINFKIKNRDFWMPFAPSILAEYADNYLVNPKHTLSPFMTIGFESTTIGREMLEAATHPADKTLRPNIVSQENNPQYHALIIEFAGITGIGGVLNTSFNLHGEPIVANADDAYRVFQLTDIDALLVEDVLVTKNSIS